MICIGFIILAFLLGIWCGLSQAWWIPAYRVVLRRIEKLEARIKELQNEQR